MTAGQSPTFGSRQSVLASSTPPSRFAVIAVPLAVAVMMGGLVAFAEVNALILFTAVFACLFVMFDYRTGVSCLILLMPISASALMPHEIGGIVGLNPLNILLAGTFAACLLQGLPAGSFRRLTPKPLVWAYVLPIVVAGGVGSRHVHEIPQNFPLHDNASTYVIEMVVKPLLIVLFAFLVGATAARSEKPERLIYALLASVWAMGLLAIGYFLLSGESLTRLTSREENFFAQLGFHPNDLGRLYAIAYALMLFTFVATRNLWLRFALAATISMTVVALLLTFSRGAFIGFAIITALFLLSLRKFALLFGCIVFAIGVLLLPEAFYDRIGFGWDSGINMVSAGRINDIWLPLLPELLEHPLFGNGLGATMWSAAMQSNQMLAVTHPHNAYLRTILDMGLVGLALIGAYWMHLWKGFRQLANDLSLSPTLRGFFAGAGAGLIGFLVAGVAGSSLTPANEQIFLWFAIGMMYGLSRRHAAETPC